MPAGTGILIFAPFFHRDDERLPYAHRFAPELWLKAQDPVAWPLIPFSGGPVICPGRHLVTLGREHGARGARGRPGGVAQAALAARRPGAAAGNTRHYSLRFASTWEAEPVVPSPALRSTELRLEPRGRLPLKRGHRRPASRMERFGTRCSQTTRLRPRFSPRPARHFGVCELRRVESARPIDGLSTGYESRRPGERQAAGGGFGPRPSRAPALAPARRPSPHVPSQQLAPFSRLPKTPRTPAKRSVPCCALPCSLPPCKSPRERCILGTVEVSRLPFSRGWAEAHPLFLVGGKHSRQA